MRNCPTCNALLRGNEQCACEIRAGNAAFVEAVGATGKAMSSLGCLLTVCVTIPALILLFAVMRGC